MKVQKHRRPKYGNKKTVVGGVQFDSKLESQRWIALQAAEQAGRIKDLKRQVPYVLTAHGSVICRYIADFEYTFGNRVITEDAKGVLTDIFKLKRKLFRAQEGRDITIIRKEQLTALPAIG